MKNKIKYFIFDDNVVDEIIVNRDKTTIKYKYKHGYYPAFNGKTAATLTDNGNGVIINFIEDERIVELDYAQVSYLVEILKAYDKYLVTKA